MPFESGQGTGLGGRMENPQVLCLQSFLRGNPTTLFKKENGEDRSTVH